MLVREEAGADCHPGLLDRLLQDPDTQDPAGASSDLRRAPSQFVQRGPFLDCDFESFFSESQLRLRKAEWAQLGREKEQLSLSTASSEGEGVLLPWVIPMYNYWVMRQAEDEFTIVLSQVGEDGRTALMIKNIPNKYTQSAILSEIDQWHEGEYDFFYLPLDPKNNCNVGYAFINFVSIASIVPFYYNFNGKRWRRYNSEKVCELKYARMQGRQSLLQHFQNVQKDRRPRNVPANPKTAR